MKSARALTFCVFRALHGDLQRRYRVSFTSVLRRCRSAHGGSFRQLLTERAVLRRRFLSRKVVGMEDRFFGPPDVQVMSRRAQALYNLVKDDPQYTWYGRFVAADFEVGGVETLLNLIRIQGASPGYFIPIAIADEVDAALEAAGIRQDWYEYVVTDGDSIARAKGILAEHALSDDLEVTRLGADSSDADLDAFAEVAGVGGVLPPPASVLRGQAKKGVFLVARDRATGQAVSCAAAVESFHPDSHAGDHGFWGMLSTVPEYRIPERTEPGNFGSPPDRCFVAHRRPADRSSLAAPAPA